MTLLTSQLAIAFPNIDPVIFELGPFALRWYSLAYIVGIVFGLWFAKWLIRKAPLWSGNTASLKEIDIDDFLLWAALGIILGGRMGYVLFYDFAAFAANPLSIFAVWNGGMSFHGGVIGLLLAMILYTRKRGLSAFSLFDLITVSSCVGLFLGRVANFINAELWGRTTDVSWGVIFPNGGPQPRHPSQLYEAMLEGVVLFIVLNLLIFGAKKLKQPGFIAGSWLVGYALSRILVEFFRVPDVQLGYLVGNWLTMGMILSLPMMLVGLWAIFTSNGRSTAV